MWSLRGWELGGQVISLREAYIQNLSLLGSLDPIKNFVVGGWVVVVSRPILVISLKFKSRLINYAIILNPLKPGVWERLVIQ